MDTKELIIKYCVAISKRFNLKQKSFFINEIGKDFQSLGYKVKGVYGKHKSKKYLNLVVGDVKKAKKIVIANYDTPHHNFGNPLNYHPFNGPATNYSSLIPTLTPTIISVLVLIYIGTVQMPKFDFENSFLSTLFWLVLTIIFMVIPFVSVSVGNKMNFNYNTSGCITALKIAEKLNEHQRKDVAFVLTDHGYRKHIGDIKLRESLPEIDNKLVVLLDCIGSGDRYAIGYQEGLKTKAEALAACFDEKVLRVNCTKESLRYTSYSYYPSGLKVSRVVVDGNSLIVKNVASNKDSECNDQYIDACATAIAKYL